MGKTSSQKKIRMNSKDGTGGADSACLLDRPDKPPSPGKTKQIFHSRAFLCGKLSGLFRENPGRTGQIRRTPGDVYNRTAAKQNCI